MIGRQRAIMVVGCAALGLSGCVAAVIPLAASGMIGGSKLRHDRHRAHGRGPAAVAATTTPAAARALPASVPAMPSAIQGGTADPRTFPPARATSATPLPAPEAPATTAGIDRSSASVWSDIMRFAAAASLKKPAVSALLARGSTTATPRWLACADKPVAVLVNLPVAGTTAFFDGAMDNLKAIETMGVTLVFVSDQPAPIVARQRALLKAGAVSAPVAGTTMFLGAASMAPAIRATIGGRYCVAAVVGSRAADFPNATLPGAVGASPGWFLIR